MCLWRGVPQVSSLTLSSLYLPLQWQSVDCRSKADFLWAYFTLPSSSSDEWHWLDCSPFLYCSFYRFTEFNSNFSRISKRKIPYWVGDRRVECLHAEMKGVHLKTGWGFWFIMLKIEQQLSFFGENTDCSSGIVLSAVTEMLLSVSLCF